MKTPITLILIVALFIGLTGTSYAQSWEEQAVGALPTNYGVFDVSVVDENVVWAVAYDRTVGNDVPSGHLIKVLKTTDGGSNWTVSDVEETPGRISFDIEAVNENVAFLTTNDLGSGVGRGLVKTEDGGTTWSNNFENTAGGVWIRFFNSQDGLVVNRQLIATTQDGGDSWQPLSSANIPDFQDDEFTIIINGKTSCQVLEDHVWFSTNMGRVFRSKDKGQTWEAFSTSLGSSAVVTGVAFTDTLNGLALANLNPLSTAFSRTSDGGETWENMVPSTSVSIVGLVAIPNTGDTFIGISGSTTIPNNRVSVFSNDFGETWETIETGISYGGIDLMNSSTVWTSRSIISSPNEATMFKLGGDIFTSTAAVRSPGSYHVFPNPFKTEINLSGSGEVQQYRLYASDGQLVRSGKMNSDRSPLNFASLEMGAYFLELTDQNGNTVTKQIIKAE